MLSLDRSFGFLSCLSERVKILAKYKFRSFHVGKGSMHVHGFHLGEGALYVEGVSELRKLWRVCWEGSLGKKRLRGRSVSAEGKPMMKPERGKLTVFSPRSCTCRSMTVLFTNLQSHIVCSMLQHGKFCSCSDCCRSWFRNISDEVTMNKNRIVAHRVEKERRIKRREGVGLYMWRGWRDNSPNRHGVIFYRNYLGEVMHGWGTTYWARMVNRVFSSRSDCLKNSYSFFSSSFPLVVWWVKDDDGIAVW